MTDRLSEKRTPYEHQCSCHVGCFSKEIAAAIQAEREAIVKEVRVFQDIVGWQKYESRNQLVQDIENMIRARTAQDEGERK